jgi:hypothetical protein
MADVTHRNGTERHRCAGRSRPEHLHATELLNCADGDGRESDDTGAL